MAEYVWKDIVEINGSIYAEEFPFSGEMIDGHYNINEYLFAVARKYGVRMRDVRTYMLDGISFNPMKLGYGADECGCYIDGVAEWEIEDDDNDEYYYKYMMLKQRIYGVLLLLLCVLIVIMCSHGETMLDRDASAILLIAPMGFSLLFSRECWL